MRLTRPAYSQDVRLFYRTATAYSQRPIRFRDPINILIQLRLYKWALSLPSEPIEIEKKELMSTLFDDTSGVTVHRLGRIIADAVQYKPHFQKNPGKTNGPVATFWWRFAHPLDLAYGVERMIASWLQDFAALDYAQEDQINTEEDMFRELEFISKQSDSDDYEFFIRRMEQLRFHVSEVTPRSSKSLCRITHQGRKLRAMREYDYDNGEIIYTTLSGEEIKRERMP